MDKLKFAAVLLLFLGLFFLFSWATYAIFGYLGFQKSALLVLISEAFFTARGTYLVATAWESYSQELKELRSDILRLPALLGVVKYNAAPALPKQPRVLPRSRLVRWLALLMVVCFLTGTSLVFGSIGSILLAAVIFQGALVGYLYKLRRSIADTQNELEDFRLTFSKNEKNRSLNT